MACSRYLLGIDVGTYGTKTCLWSADGILVSAARREYGVSHPQPLWAEQDPEVWWKACTQTTREVMEKAGLGAPNISGIGLSAYVPPLVALDQRGDVLRPAIMSFDQRSLPQAERLRDRAGREIFETTGNRVAPGAFSSTSMAWLKEEEPEVFTRVHKFVHANGYIAHRLTGRFSMDYSNASMTLLFDVAKKTWSERLCDAVGVPIEKLPEPVGSWEVVGGLTTEAAVNLGLGGGGEGVPVVAGGNDSACSMLGAGVVEPGMVFESMGSSIVFAYVSERPVSDERLMNRCHVVPDRWISLAGMNTPGACYRWFREEFGGAEKIVAERLGIDAYSLLDKEADDSPPGAHGLVFLPYFSGERSPIWNSDARGVFFGLTLSHRRADLIRAILEGGAYAVLDNMEALAEKGLRIGEVTLAGGGANSGTWRRIMADVIGAPLRLASTVETATLGAAILAGCGAGLYRDPRTASKELSSSSEVEKPRMEEHERYSARFRLFKKVYECLLPCYTLARTLERGA